MGGLTSEENYGRCGEQVRYASLLFSAALALLEKLKVDSRFCPGESRQISSDQSFSFHRLIHDSWPEIGPGYIFFLALFDKTTGQLTLHAEMSEGSPGED